MLKFPRLSDCQQQDTRQLVLRLRRRLSRSLRHVSISKRPSEWTIEIFRCDLLSMYVEQSPRRCGEVSTSSRVTLNAHPRLWLLRTMDVSRYEHVLANIVDVDDTSRLGLDYIHVDKSPTSMHSNPSNAQGKWHPVSRQALAASEDLRPPLASAGVAGVTMFAREFEMTRALTRRSNDRGPSDEQLSRTPKSIRETTPDAVETMPRLAGPR